MRCFALSFVVAALIPLAGSGNADGERPDPAPLTEAEALALIEKTPEELARLIEQRTSLDHEQTNSVIEILAAWSSFVGQTRRSLDRDWRYETDLNHDRLTDAELARHLPFRGVTAEDYRRELRLLGEGLIHAGADDWIQRLASAPLQHVTINPENFSEPTIDLTRRAPVHFIDYSAYAMRSAARAGDGDLVARRFAASLEAIESVYGGVPGQRALLHQINAIDQILDAGVRYPIMQASLKPDDCAAMIESLQAIDIISRMEREFADGLILAAFGLQLGYRSPAIQASRELPIQDQWRVVVERDFLQRKYLAVAVHDRDAWLALDSELEAWQAQYDEPRFELAHQVLVTNPVLLVRLNAFQSLIRGCVLLLALEQHRLEHGVYPESLKNLAPVYLEAVPLDPLSPDGFRYSIEPEAPIGPLTGYTLYSVGADLDDDGGVWDPKEPDIALFPKGRNSDRFDLVMNLPYWTARQSWRLP